MMCQRRNSAGRVMLLLSQMLEERVAVEQIWGAAVIFVRNIRLNASLKVKELEADTNLSQKK
jgi:hypothetical protein